jgi:hypothetical protein
LYPFTEGSVAEFQVSLTWIPFEGVMISADVSAPVLPRPPAARTVPSGSNVAVWLVRATVRSPVVVHCPVVGL